MMAVLLLAKQLIPQNEVTIHTESFISKNASLGPEHRLVRG